MFSQAIFKLFRVSPSTKRGWLNQSFEDKLSFLENYSLFIPLDRQFSVLKVDAQIPYLLSLTKFANSVKAKIPVFAINYTKFYEFCKAKTRF